MPRKVDHAERRRELLEALWRVVERAGLAAVSYRDVAAEAGVSVRLVQYYFPTKAELLADALELVASGWSPTLSGRWQRWVPTRRPAIYCALR